MYQEDKQSLQEIGTDVAGLAALIPGSAIGSELGDWRKDIEDDFFCVVLVGLFNRGKSSLLNSLLGRELLPVGITPTTAILTVIRHSERPCMFVHRHDGSVTEFTSSPEMLSSFGAEGDANRDGVDYLEVGLNHPMLAHGMVYVDTPGVSDLNREREGITYRFVPRADAVLFVLDATAAVTQSEMDFLESTVLKSRIDRLLFASNFSDHLNPEERAEGVVSARNRIEEALGEHNYPVFLVCASSVQKTSSNANAGIPLLRQALTDLQCAGPRSAEKLLRMRNRLDALVTALLIDLSKAERAAALDDAALNQQFQELEKRWRRREESIAKIAVWTRERESELLAMARKSLKTFAEDLREEIEDTVSSYTGADFKSYVETQIPLYIKRRCKGWIEGHSDAMQQLLQRISTSLSEGLGAEFGSRIQPLKPKVSRRQIVSTGTIEVIAPDVSDARLKAGLLVGGAGFLMMVLGGGMLYPLVAVAGYPYLSNGLEKARLKVAKQAFAPDLNRILDDVTERFSADVLATLQTDLHGLQLAAEDRYHELLQGELRQVQQEKSRRQESGALVRDRQTQLQELTQKLQECKERIGNFNGLKKVATA
jgi:GTPase SAR1 family protein